MFDVAIVGNAYKLKRQNVGSLIDNHETVVRIHPLKLDKNITGTKTDIYCCEPHTYNRFKDANIDCRLWMMTPEIMTDQHKSIFQKKFGFTNEYMDFPFEFERELRVYCRARPTDNMAPTTGGKVIYTICKMYPRANITLYGFDWYSESPNNYWYDEKKEGQSNKPERKFKVEKAYIERELSKMHSIKFNNDVIQIVQEPVAPVEPVEQVEPVTIEQKETLEVNKEVSNDKNIRNNEVKRSRRSVRHNNSNADKDRNISKQTLL